MPICYDKRNTLLTKCRTHRVNMLILLRVLLCGNLRVILSS